MAATPHFDATRLGAAGLAAALTLAGCAGPAAAPRPRSALDSLIAFSNPAMCEMTPESAALLAGMVRIIPDVNREDWITPGKVRAPLHDRFGPITMARHEGWRSVTTRTRGTLWGLPLVAIHQAFPEGGDPGSVDFEFAASAEDVERQARARGFVARAGQTVPMGPIDALQPVITLVPAPDRPRHSLLGCGYN